MSRRPVTCEPDKNKTPQARIGNGVFSRRSRSHSLCAPPTSVPFSFFLFFFTVRSLSSGLRASQRPTKKLPLLLHLRRCVSERVALHFSRSGAELSCRTSLFSYHLLCYASPLLPLSFPSSPAVDAFTEKVDAMRQQSMPLSPSYRPPPSPLCYALHFRFFLFICFLAAHLCSSLCGPLVARVYCLASSSSVPH